MRKGESRILAAAILTATLAVPATAQPALPPPLPDEIRPTIVAVAPPPLRVETMSARPGPGHVWARGYWDWDGDSWAWVPGRWAVGPTKTASWIPARYERVSGGWRYVPSHWSSQRVVSAKAAGRAKVKGKAHPKGKGRDREKPD